MTNPETPIRIVAGSNLWRLQRITAAVDVNMQRGTNASFLAGAWHGSAWWLYSAVGRAVLGVPPLVRQPQSTMS